MRVRAAAAVIAATAIAGALALAGCGGGGSSDQLSKSDYSTKLKQELTPLQDSLQKLQTDAQSATTRQQLTSALGAADNAVQKASDGIDALDAPSDSTSSNADLVTALDTYEKSIALTEETIRSGSKQEITAQVASFQKDSQQFVTSLNKIRGQLQSEGIKVSGK